MRNVRAAESKFSNLTDKTDKRRCPTFDIPLTRHPDCFYRKATGLDEIEFGANVRGEGTRGREQALVLIPSGELSLACKFDA